MRQATSWRSYVQPITNKELVPLVNKLTDNSIEKSDELCEEAHHKRGNSNS